MRNDGILRFGGFTLDPQDRMLRRDGHPVEMGARCLDALILLAREDGRLVTKDRFMSEVWRGAAVTDEALTQCIRTLRRQLGDDAGAPRFIETVPRHGYRFAMPVVREVAARPIGDERVPPAPSHPRWRHALASGGAGTLGAAMAGVVGGIAFGALAAGQAPDGAGDGASIVLVVLWLTIVTATAGGAGVGFGIALAGLARAPGWRIAGGAAGGMVVGAVVKLVGLDAFHLLLGRSPAAMAGGGEGLLLGAAVGVASIAMHHRPAPRAGRSLALAALAGGAGGVAVTLLGGNLMAGSLAALFDIVPASRLGGGAPGAAWPGGAPGRFLPLAMAGAEGALFATCITGAMALHAGQATNTSAPPAAA